MDPSTSNENMNIFKREFLVFAIMGENNIRSTSLKYLVKIFLEIGEIIILANLWLFKIFSQSDREKIPQIYFYADFHDEIVNHHEFPNEI